MKFCVLGILVVCVCIFSGRMQAATLEAVETEDAISIFHGDEVVLIYHKAEVMPPEGVDAVFKRSGFIHPIKTLKGVEVTGTRPDDHYHHMGLWHAWVKTKHDGEEVDFWNLKRRQGTVRFVETAGVRNGEDECGFTVRQEQVKYVGDDKEAVQVLEETLSVSARVEDGVLMIDYDLEQENVTDAPLELPQYRYGGPMAYRAPHHWDQTNSDYLSSEGKTREDGHETRSKWCAFWGPAQAGGEELVSLTILCHPGNHDFPQRMRVWPPTSNNGAIFFNYVPIQETGWAIQPRETVAFRYRLVVDDEMVDAGKMDGIWAGYSESNQ
ncbi:MAG: PmoA family protein [Verrucomicrobiota bacterium]